MVIKFIKHDSTSNLCEKEKRALHKLVTENNRVHVINDTDKNLGPANADKTDVINECKRQLYDVVTYSYYQLKKWNRSYKKALKLFAEQLITIST